MLAAGVGLWWLGTGNPGAEDPGGQQQAADQQEAERQTSEQSAAPEGAEGRDAEGRDVSTQAEAELHAPPSGDAPAGAAPGQSGDKGQSAEGSGVEDQAQEVAAAGEVSREEVERRIGEALRLRDAALRERDAQAVTRYATAGGELARADEGIIEELLRRDIRWDRLSTEVLEVEDATVLDDARSASVDGSQANTGSEASDNSGARSGTVRATVRITGFPQEASGGEELIARSEAEGGDEETGGTVQRIEIRWAEASGSWMIEQVTVL